MNKRQQNLKSIDLANFFEKLQELLSSMFDSVEKIQEVVSVHCAMSSAHLSENGGLTFNEAFQEAIRTKKRFRQIMGEGGKPGVWYLADSMNPYGHWPSFGERKRFMNVDDFTASKMSSEPNWEMEE